MSMVQEENMAENTIIQASGNSEQPTPEQFRANFKEIFEAETTFGSPRGARDELLKSVEDFIKEYLNKGSHIVYLYGKLKDAGYSGSRKELTEWLIMKGLWIKRKPRKTKGENGEVHNSENDTHVHSADENMESNKFENSQCAAPMKDKDVITSICNVHHPVTYSNKKDVAPPIADSPTQHSEPQPTVISVAKSHPHDRQQR